MWTRGTHFNNNITLLIIIDYLFFVFTEFSDRQHSLLGQGDPILHAHKYKMGGFALRLKIEFFYKMWGFSKFYYKVEAPKLW